MALLYIFKNVIILQFLPKIKQNDNYFKDNFIHGLRENHA